MAYRYGIDRNQLMMLPPVLDQYVTHDHPVRAYDAFVELSILGSWEYRLMSARLATANTILEAC